MWLLLLTSAFAGVPASPRSHEPLLVGTDPVAEGLKHLAAAHPNAGPVVAVRMPGAGMCCGPHSVLVRNLAGTWVVGVYLGADDESLGPVLPCRYTNFEGSGPGFLPAGPTPATALRSALRALRALSDDDDVLVAAPAPGGTFDVWTVRPSPEHWRVVASARVDGDGRVSEVHAVDEPWTPRPGASAAALGALVLEASRKGGPWRYQGWFTPRPEPLDVSR